MGSASKGSTSSEKTITDKGKGIMNKEQVHEEKSEQETNPMVDEGVGVPCAPNIHEILLSDMRLRILEVPIFKGDEEGNVDGWLHRVERYFVVNRLTERDKLDAAVLCLEGEALDWYQWKEDRKKICKTTTGQNSECFCG